MHPPTWRSHIRKAVSSADLGPAGLPLPTADTGRVKVRSLADDDGAVALTVRVAKVESREVVDDLVQ